MAITRDFTVATFVVHAGKVLLLYHQKLHMWLPPGGHIEAGELPDEAALREVREETGLAAVLASPPALTDVSGPRQLARPEGIQLEDIRPGHQHVDLIYFARLEGSSTPRPGDGESSQVGWFGPADWPGLKLTAEVHTWAARALATIGDRRDQDDASTVQCH